MPDQPHPCFNTTLSISCMDCPRLQHRDELISFVGIQNYGSGPFAMFNHHETRGTFSVRIGQSIRDGLNELLIRYDLPTIHAASSHHPAPADCPRANTNTVTPSASSGVPSGRPGDDSSPCGSTQIHSVLEI